MALVTHLRDFGTTALDFVLPPRCHSCNARVLDDKRLCANCWATLNLISAPSCTVCDLPFDFEPGTSEMGKGCVCASCLANPPKFDRALTAALYDDASKALTLKLKQGRATALAGPMAAIMAARLLQSGLVAEDTSWLVAPIPLHQTRFRYRRFNQSHLLAKALVKHMNEIGQGSSKLVFAPHLLVRTRDTKSQGGLSRKGRKRNLVNAFEVVESEIEAIKGKAVLLIDDVFTTGATVEAAAHSLKKAGAESVAVLCFARAPGPR